MDGGIQKDIASSFADSFALICNSILIEGYREAIIDGNYKLDWKEDSFTNYIASFMRKSQEVVDKCIFIKTQVEPENDNLPVEGTKDDPNMQPRIDFWLGSFTSSQSRAEYYIEAKNLCSADWKKTTGAEVSASKLKRRYITTGIENFKTGRYPKGCLAGYVLNGKPNDCVSGINKLLTSDNRKTELLEIQPDLNGFTELYQSTHNSANLKHFMFEF